VDNRTCIFCGATGASVKITREHTFSNWINQVLTRDVIGPDISCERSIMRGPQAGTVNTWPAVLSDAGLTARRRLWLYESRHMKSLVL
jgi:hypothetical protein